MHEMHDRISHGGGVSVEFFMAKKKKQHHQGSPSSPDQCLTPQRLCLYALHGNAKCGCRPSSDPSLPVRDFWGICLPAEKRKVSALLVAKMRAIACTAMSRYKYLNKDEEKSHTGRSYWNESRQVK